MTDIRSLLIQRLPAILLALGIVVWIQEIFSIEWSFPYCSDQSDGPASAVWGMPLPYIRWSTVSSMEYFWMPSAFFLNIGLLFAVAYPPVSWALQRAHIRVSSPHVSEGARNMTGAVLSKRKYLLPLFTSGVGSILVLAFAALLGLQINIGLYRIPVTNIANENYDSYTDFRPVHFGFKTLRYQCTPLK